MSIVGSLVGGILGSGAANDASKALQQGSQAAQNTIKQGQQTSQDFLNKTWGGTQQNFNPYLSLGSTSAHNLEGLLGTGFKAPNPNDVASTPEYQFALSQGQHAIDSDAAARGTLLSGNTGVALQNYGQGLASQQYQQAYNNALQGYYANLQGLTSGTNIGEGATSTLGTLGNQAINANTGINMGAASEIAQQQNAAAQARASGYLGSASAWSTAVGGGIGSLAGGFGNMSRDSSPWENVGNFALGALAI